MRDGFRPRTPPAEVVAAVVAIRPIASDEADLGEPTRLPLRGVATGPLAGRHGDLPEALTDEVTLLRLALWLADVAIEAAHAATEPDASVAAWRSRVAVRAPETQVAR